jgi:hypothetical protein
LFTYTFRSVDFKRVSGSQEPRNEHRGHGGSRGTEDAEKMGRVHPGGICNCLKEKELQKRYLELIDNKEVAMHGKSRGVWK